MGFRHFAPGPGGFMEPWWVLAARLGFDLLLVALVIVAIVLLVRAFSHPQRGWYAPVGSRTPALAELELRYARGELSRDEFLQRRADLMGLPSSPPPPAPPPPAKT